jgi:hypothetical protein
VSGFKHKVVDKQRRKLFLGSLAVGAAGLLQACGGGGSIDDASASEQPSAAPAAAGAPEQASMHAASTVVTPAAIPSHQVNLADFGGAPTAAPATIVSAFVQAFARLKSLGGGTLIVPPGTYHIGSYAGTTNAIAVNDLQNVLISAYDAKLTMTTTSSTPAFLHFENPNNVTVAGMSFFDHGTNLNINWQGGVCISVNTTYARQGFKTVDCLAESVVIFFRTYGNYTLTGCDINGTVRNSYYGVNPNYNGSFSKCNVTCDRVRRGFLAYGTRNWDVTLKCNSVAGALGSNGFVDFIPDATWPVENCTLHLIVTGDASPYRSYVNFYHQGDAGARQHMRNVKVHVELNNVTGAPGAGVFWFIHEPPAVGVASSTIRTWEQMVLSGSVAGAFAGAIISNPTLSTGTTNLVHVESALAAHQNMSALPGYFKVFTAAQCSA